MRVLLISPNQEVSPDPVFPLGLGYLAAAVKSRGWPVEVADLCFSREWEKALRDQILAFQPEGIGLSIRNVDNVTYPATVSYLPFLKEVMGVCRRFSPSPVILGGSGFTLLPAEILEFLQADYGVVGEGEQGFIQLLEALSSTREVGYLPGVISRREGKANFNQADFTADLDGLSWPARDLFDLTSYGNRGAMGNLQTKRGCPFQCVYCTYPLIEGTQVRIRDPRSVVQEIESMMSAGLDYIFFVDNNFNFPPDHALSICREMQARRLPVHWTAYVNPGFVSRPLLTAMKASGCLGLEFGIDSASPRQLPAMGKNFSLQDIQDTADLCHQIDLPFCFSLLLGGPGETMDSVQETLDQVVSLQPTAVICMTGIRLFPRTRLARLASQEGLLPQDWDPLQPFFYLSAQVKDKIEERLKQFSQDHSSWIFPGLGIDLDPQRAERMHKMGLKGPLWTYLRPKRRREKRIG